MKIRDKINMILPEQQLHRRREALVEVNHLPPQVFHPLPLEQTSQRVLQLI